MLFDPGNPFRESLGFLPVPSYKAGRPFACVPLWDVLSCPAMSAASHHCAADRRPSGPQTDDLLSSSWVGPLFPPLFDASGTPICSDAAQLAIRDEFRDIRQQDGYSCFDCRVSRAPCVAHFENQVRCARCEGLGQICLPGPPIAPAPSISPSDQSLPSSVSISTLETDIYSLIVKRPDLFLKMECNRLTLQLVDLYHRRDSLARALAALTGELIPPLPSFLGGPSLTGP